MSSAQSIRDRLLNVAKERNEEFNLTLIRYALERFLYRLSLTSHREEMILKGAMLFQIWNDTPHRATRDLDLLASGEVNPEKIEAKIREICEIEVDEDGLVFHLDELTVQEIREESRYGGIRASFVATLTTARIPIQIDFGVGDAVTPSPVETEYPTLLEMKAPVVFIYPKETVVAEKLSAIVEHDIGNSRMKDYFDLWFIATTYNLDPDQLKTAVQRTFDRRGQFFPTKLPVGLSDEFAQSPAKQAQWKAFQARATGTTLSLEEVVETVRKYAEPLLIDQDLGHSL